MPVFCLCRDPHHRPSWKEGLQTTAWRGGHLTGLSSTKQTEKLLCGTDFVLIHLEGKSTHGDTDVSGSSYRTDLHEERLKFCGERVKTAVWWHEDEKSIIYLVALHHHSTTPRIRDSLKISSLPKYPISRVVLSYQDVWEMYHHSNGAHPHKHFTVWRQ